MSLFVLPQLLLEEAHVLDRISRQPHPNIIRYYGCRVHRGFITGLVMDYHENDLNEHLKAGFGDLEKGPFMAALEAGIRHLHSLGLAHNDINPANIMVDESRMPVLVDFGSCKEIGQKLTISRGTDGWTDSEEDYSTSEPRHDLFAL